MDDRLGRSLAHSVTTATFDEELCSAIESLPASTAVIILDKFYQGRSELNDEQGAVLLHYLHRFMVILGHERIRFVYPVVFSFLNTRELELQTILLKFLKELLIRDHTVGTEVLQIYFRSRHALSFQVAMQYADIASNSFLASLVAHIMSEDTRPNALHLLATFLVRQGPPTTNTADGQVIRALLDVLKEEKRVEVCSSALMVLIMFLPASSAGMGGMIDTLLDVFERLCLEGCKEVHDGLNEDSINTDSADTDSKQPKENLTAIIPNSVLRRPLAKFFSMIYATFPNVVVDRMRDRCVQNHRLRLMIEPLWRALPLHPMLLRKSSGGKDGAAEEIAQSGENAAAWWKSLDGHHLIVDEGGLQSVVLPQNKIRLVVTVTVGIKENRILVMSGSLDSLGAWDPKEGIMLESIGDMKYRAEMDIDEAFEYKLVFTGEKGDLWEDIENRRFSFNLASQCRGVIYLHINAKFPNKSEVADQPKGLLRESIERAEREREGEDDVNALDSSLIKDPWKILTDSLGDRALDGAPGLPSNSQTSVSSVKNDGGASMRLEKLLAIQKIIEEEIEGNQVINTDTALSGLPIEYYQKQLLLKRNEVLLEKHMRKQSNGLIKRLRKQLQAANAAARGWQSKFEGVWTKSDDVDAMSQMVLRQKEEIRVLKDKQLKWEMELTQRMHRIDEEARALKSRTTELQLENDRVRAENEHMKEDLCKKNEQIFEQYLKAVDMDARVASREKYEESVHVLTEENHRWELYHQQKLDATVAALEEKRDTLVSSLNNRLARALEKISCLEARALGQENVVKDLTAQLEKTRQVMDEQKDLLEYHKQVSRDKLESVNQKYLTIKEINIALQNRIMDLGLELEKMKRDRTAFLSQSGSQTSGDVEIVN